MKKKKDIEISVIKKIKVTDSPFKAILYILKNDNNVIVEDPSSGKSIIIGSYDVGNYIRFKNTYVPWKQTFNHSYIEYKNGEMFHFIPLFREKHKFVNLSFVIDRKLAPPYKTKKIGSSFIAIDDFIDPEYDLADRISQEKKTYKYLFQNVREFEVENFKLEMLDTRTPATGHTATPNHNTIYEEIVIVDPVTDIISRNVGPPIKLPYITCRLPIFQLFTIIKPMISTLSNGRKRYGYDLSQIFMKINNRFYKYPYGNTGTEDRMCLGDIHTTQLRKEPDSIDSAVYAHVISSDSNGDYASNLRYDNEELTTFNIDLIRQKVNNDDFSISFMDAIFYLSQCNSIEEINLNIFMVSINVPKDILRMEGCDAENINVAAARHDDNPVGNNDDTNDDEPDRDFDREPEAARDTLVETQPRGPIDELVIGVPRQNEFVVNAVDAATTIEYRVAQNARIMRARANREYSEQLHDARRERGERLQGPIEIRETNEFDEVVQQAELGPEPTPIESDCWSPVTRTNNWRPVTLPIGSTLVINGVETIVTSDSTAAENPNADSTAAEVPLSSILLGEVELSPSIEIAERQAPLVQLSREQQAALIQRDPNEQTETLNEVVNEN